jgi:hypothetical protein
LLLLGFRALDKFYISGKVFSDKLENPIEIFFLIDTGASKTQLGWNDAQKNGIDIRKLPQNNRISTGIGGRVKSYLLTNSNIIFNGLRGTLNFKIKNLNVSDYETIDKKSAPPTPSLLGIDFLIGFNILFDKNIVYLKRDIDIPKK